MPINIIEGADALRALSAELFEELLLANKRLTHQLLPTDVLAAIRRVAQSRSAISILLQPASLPGSCSTGQLPLMFLASHAGGVRIRIRRGKQTYGRRYLTPGAWPELRLFPRGDAAGKIRQWAKSTDGVTISIEAGVALPVVKSGCRIECWILTEDGKYISDIPHPT